MYYGRSHRRHFDILPRQNETLTPTKRPLGVPDAVSSPNVSTPTPTSSSVESTPSSSVETTKTSSSSATTSTRISSSESSSPSPSTARESSTRVSTPSPSPSPSTSSLPPSSISTLTPSTTSASRSSSTVESEILQLTPAPNPPPGTFIFTPGSPSDTPTTIISTYTFSPSATKEPVSGVTDGFWQNTGAVAGTFTALGVFVLGIIVAFFVLRRRRAHRSLAEDEYFESFSVGPGMMRNSGHSTSSGHTESPGPSVSELAIQAPMDAYARNQMHNMNYGPGYPAGTSYGLPSVDERDYSNYSDPPPMSQQASYPAASQMQSQQYYVPPPARAVHAEQAAPRRSYQRSIDSFYGAT